jgi:hypothetical protein
MNKRCPMNVIDVYTKEENAKNASYVEAKQEIGRFTKDIRD